MILLLMGAALAGTPQLLPTQSVAVGDAVVNVEVADDPQKRAVGLMHRPALEPDAGMLFVYPDQALRSFWMKDTLVPLSVAFIDADGVIVHIADMAPLDLRAVRSNGPAQYALEMNQGWFAAHGVTVGAHVDGLPPASTR